MDTKAHTVETAPAGTRVRVCRGGKAIADSTEALVLHETGHAAVYYFPRRDVHMDLLHPTGHATTCPFKGEASYWTLRMEDGEVESAAWAYLDPIPEAEAIRGYVAFYLSKLETAYEFPEG